MATAVQPTPVSWDQLIASSAWSALSSARKVWVTAYLSNGSDALAATRTSYPTATEKSIRCMSYELRKVPEIVACIEFYHGGVTREVLLSEVREAIRKAEPGSIAHQRLLAQLERLALGEKSQPEVDDEPHKDSQPNAKNTFHIGQRVTQRDEATGILHTGVVRAIDPDGKPTQIEEIE
jgi:hypothetical protein